MCSLQCSLHEVIKEEQTRVALDSQVTQHTLVSATGNSLPKGYVTAGWSNVPFFGFIDIDECMIWTIRTEKCLPIFIYFGARSM